MALHGLCRDVTGLLYPVLASRSCIYNTFLRLTCVGTANHIVFKTQFLDPANEPRSALFLERP